MKNTPIKGWTVWFIASFFYFYQYILRVLPNIIMPEVMAKFEITASTFGQFSGLYYLGYVAVHIPIGLALDRIGPKKVLPVCILLTVSGLLPVIYADNWLYPCLGRVLLGAGSSAAILGVFKVVRMVFEEKLFTTMLGTSVTIGLIGGIWGGEPVNYLMGLYGWENVILGLFAGGVILAAATYTSIPELEPEETPTGILKDIIQVFTCKRFFIVCTLGGLMLGPMEGFADAWGTEFLKSVHGLNDDIASALPSFIFFGMAVGSPLLSFFAAQTNAYYRTIILSAVVMTLGFLYLMYAQASTMSHTGSLFIVGFFCAYQILVIYKASSYLPARLVALSTSCANMLIMTFGYFYHSAIGLAIDHFWTGEMIDGAPHYSADTFIKGISVIPIACTVAAMGFLVLHLRKKDPLTDAC